MELSCDSLKYKHIFRRNLTMEKNVYVCPICGSKHTSAVSLANCVSECAKKESEKEKAKANAISTVTKKWNELTRALKEYNAINGDSVECKIMRNGEEWIKYTAKSDETKFKNEKTTTIPDSEAIDDELVSLTQVLMPDMSKEEAKQLVEEAKRSVEEFFAGESNPLDKLFK